MLRVTVACFVVMGTLVVHLGLAGCGGSSTTNGGGVPENWTITPARSTITAQSGKVIINTQANAVAADTNITIQPLAAPPADARLIPGTAFSFTPDGTAFLRPTMLTIAYSPASLPAGADEADLRMGKVVGGTWEVVIESTPDPVGNTVTARIDGFSSYGILLVAGASASGVTIVSDPSWLAVHSAPAGWTAAAFDDSGWGRAVLGDAGPWTQEAKNKLPELYATGAWLIWEAGTAAHQTCYMRKHFTLLKTPAKGRLLISVDDDYELWVNGTKVGKGDDQWRDHETWDVTALLKVGDNVIALSASDIHGDVWWVLAALKIEW